MPILDISPKQIYQIFLQQKQIAPTALIIDNSVPSIRGFIARARRVFNIELHIAREKNKLLFHFQKQMPLSSLAGVFIVVVVVVIYIS